MRKKLILIVAACLICGLVGSYFAFWQRTGSPVTNPSPAQGGVNQTGINQTEPAIDSDDDGVSDWFEENVAHYDPNVPNNRYFILFHYPIYDSIEPSNVDLPAQFLIEKGKVPPENILKLTQKEATASALQNAIEQIAKKADENDIVYLGIDAHGSGNIGVTPLDVGFYATDRCIKYVELNEWLNQIKARVLILSIASCGGELAVPVLKEGPCPRIIYLGASNWFLQMFGLNKDYFKEITTYYSNDPYISIGEAADCLDDQRVYLSDWNITRERKNEKRIVTYKRDGGYHVPDESKAKILAIDSFGYVRAEIDSSLYPYTALVDTSNIAYKIYLTD